MLISLPLYAHSSVGLWDNEVILFWIFKEPFVLHNDCTNVHRQQGYPFPQISQHLPYSLGMANPAGTRRCVPVVFMYTSQLMPSVESLNSSIVCILYISDYIAITVYLSLSCLNQVICVFVIELFRFLLWFDYYFLMSYVICSYCFSPTDGLFITCLFPLWVLFSFLVVLHLWTRGHIQKYHCPDQHKEPFSMLSSNSFRAWFSQFCICGMRGRYSFYSSTWEVSVSLAH